MTSLLLIHGGLWEEGMDADRFWGQPGITAGLQRCGFEVLAPSRLRQAPNWTAEASHLASMLSGPAVVLAGSNGCSAAARMAVDFPGTVTRLILAWPATAGDPAIDAPARVHLAAHGASPEVTDALLAGQTLRGLTDTELAALNMPAAVLPSDPPNPFHQQHTANTLLRLLPQAEELPGSPEPPRPEFPPHLNTFVNAVAAFASERPTASTHSDSCDT